VACYPPGDRPHPVLPTCWCTGAARARPRVQPGRLRDLILAAHRELSARWSGSGTTSTSTGPELADFAEENKAWLRVYRLPAYAPDLNPAEGIWSLIKRSMVNIRSPLTWHGLVRIVKAQLKKIQYRLT